MPGGKFLSHNEFFPLFLKFIRNRLPASYEITRSTHFSKRMDFLKMISKGPWRAQKRMPSNVGEGFQKEEVP